MKFPILFGLAFVVFSLSICHECKEKGKCGGSKGGAKGGEQNRTEMEQKIQKINITQMCNTCVDNSTNSGLVVLNTNCNEVLGDVAAVAAVAKNLVSQQCNANIDSQQENADANVLSKTTDILKNE